VDADGSVLYIADTGNARVRAVNISGECGESGPVATIGDIDLQPGNMITVLGTGAGGEAGCEREALVTYGGRGQDTPLSCPRGLAVVPVCDEFGNCEDKYLVVSDTDHHQLLAMSLDDLTVSRFAGLTDQPGYDSGMLSDAKLNLPHGITYNADADVFLVADYGNSMIRMISLDDPDNDQVGSNTDNCPQTNNPDQTDTDGDGDGIQQGDGSNPCVGGATQDCDDNCPDTDNPDQADGDDDGVGDACDGCPETSNPRQDCVDNSDCINAGFRCVYDRDTDTSGHCSGQNDRDWDGVPDECDLCPDVYDKSNSDIVPDGIGDGYGDACHDLDGDGITDLEEITIGKDGFISDPLSTDSDGDGLDDAEEVVPGADGFITDPMKADTDGDGCNDKEDVGDGALCPPGSRGSRNVVRDGNRTPTDALPPPPEYWILEIQDVHMRFESSDPSLPRAGYLNINGPNRIMVGPISKDVGHSGDMPVGGWWGQAETNVGDHDFICPEDVKYDECYKDCVWLPVAQESVLPIIAGGVFSEDSWYFGIGLGFNGEKFNPNRLDQYLVTYIASGVGRQYCEGGFKIFNGDAVVNYYGGVGLGDYSLPTTCSLYGNPCSFSVPYLKLQEGDEIDGITYGFAYTYGGVTIKTNGTVNFIPIYPEVQDTPTDWLPGARFADIDGSDGNDTIEKKISLKPMAIGGEPVRARVRVTLYDRTSYNGYTMNASYDNELDSEPDLFVEPADNAGWDCAVVGEGADAEMQCEMDMNSQDQPAKLLISSYDFAAYGKIRVNIVKHIDGPNVEELNIISDNGSRGRVEDRPSKEYFTTIPQDRGEGVGKKGNKIADCGWNAENAKIYDFATGNPADDIDNDPQFGPDGDDLVTLEEYRGFIIYGNYMRTNPFKKDVFIASTEGIYYAYPAMPTATHRILFNEYEPNTQIINWAAGGIDGHRMQCAIPILGNITETPGQWEWGYTTPKGNKTIPGPPCNVKTTDVNKLQIKVDNATHQADEQILTNYTVGHEVGHGVSIPHKDCTCGEAKYSMMCTSNSIGPPGCLFTSTPSYYKNDDLDNLDLLNP